ncbi:MAG: M48 family metallopeptidase [Desulfovibrionaceae bacterium]
MSAIQFGLSAISFEVLRANRKTLAIHVFPDGEVVVIAPSGAPQAAIEATVRKRAPWIIKQRRVFASYPPEIPARQYASGETFRYLGRQYRIRIVRATARSAKLKGAYLTLSILEADQDDVAKKLMNDWLRSKAKRIFSDLLAQCAHEAASIGVAATPPLRLLSMKKRWGSCTNEGIVILNPELVAAPKDCIEYLIFHELCHLRVRNHTPTFYRLLHRLAPEWKMLRLKLNQSVELRLEY